MCIFSILSSRCLQNLEENNDHACVSLIQNQGMFFYNLAMKLDYWVDIGSLVGNKFRLKF